MRALKVQWADSEWEARADRSLFWPQQDWLLVADLHLGKAETFQAHGIAVPSGSDDADLFRLSTAMAETAAKHLVILGDLVHHRSGWQPQVRQRWQSWLNRTGLPVTLILGNHDRYLKSDLAFSGMNIVAGEVLAGTFCFSHEPRPFPDHAVVAGHVHPVHILRGGSDRLRLPCFEFGEKLALLPAFSSFAGGYERPAAPGCRHVLIAGDQLSAL